MKRLLPALLPLLLFLGACSPSTPPTPFSPSAGEILTSVARTLTALPSQTPAVVYVTPVEGTPTPPLPTNTLAPTNTTAPPAPQTIIIIYPTAYPTAILYPTAIVYPTAAPVWSPAYADQFIYYYFQRINSRDYTTAWSLLTESFKAVANPDGYAGYASFWNTVQRVDIQYLSFSSLTGTTATVMVGMIYNYNNGYVVPSNQTFHLFYDSWRGTWMFDSAAGTVPTPVPTAVTPPYYPADFIYYYFSNINLRNYSLTWSLLAPSFIANNNPPSSGGYTGYVNFWNSVSRVDITYVTVNSLSGSYADVSVGMVFNYSSGIVTTAAPLYHLVYNYSLASWQFYSP